MYIFFCLGGNLILKKGEKNTLQNNYRPDSLNLFPDFIFCITHVQYNVCNGHWQAALLLRGNTIALFLSPLSFA